MFSNFKNLKILDLSRNETVKSDFLFLGYSYKFIIKHFEIKQKKTKWIINKAKNKTTLLIILYESYKMYYILIGKMIMKSILRIFKKHNEFSRTN